MKDEELLKRSQIEEKILLNSRDSSLPVMPRLRIANSQCQPSLVVPIGKVLIIFWINDSVTLDLDYLSSILSFHTTELISDRRLETGE